MLMGAAAAAKRVEWQRPLALTEGAATVSTQSLQLLMSTLTLQGAALTVQRCRLLSVRLCTALLM
jgi:hypothetical protein